jgi:hypothetical protein
MNNIINGDLQDRCWAGALPLSIMSKAQEDTLGQTPNKQ